MKGDGYMEPKIQWHPAFCSAAELEFRADRNSLEFYPEKNLSRRPLEMDLLIIRKNRDISLQNEIGKLFKTYNILEYKSPDDGLNIDDYYKTISYACLYKSLGKTVNAIPAEELTISLFRDSYPRKLIKQLKKQGAIIEKKFPGIYYVTSKTLFDTQIVVTGQLSEETHSSLRVLTKDLQEKDVKTFLTLAEKFQTQGDKNNVDSILQVSVKANRPIYEMVREDLKMCEALRELMKDEIDAEVAKGMERGIEQGMERGIEQGMERGLERGILSSINNLMCSTKMTAEQAMEALMIPKNKRDFYYSKLLTGDNSSSTY
jgi:hypothetical protein